MRPLGLGIVLTCTVVRGVTAAQPEIPPMPDPLTLEFALSQASSAHPELEAQKAMVAWHQATLDEARVLPADDETRRAAVRAAEADLHGSKLRLRARRQRRALAILQGYFDVLLADLRYARENEAMAIAYVRLQRAQERAALGQRSDIDVLELESRYQERRRQRYESQAEQRARRLRLAVALNRPNELSARLELPALPNNGRALLEFEAVQASARSRNPRLRALRAHLEASVQRLAATRAFAGTGLYTAPGGSTPPLAARTGALWPELNVLGTPLALGRTREGDIARRQAEVSLLEAQLAAEEMRVEQCVLRQWLTLQTLQAARDAASSYASFRDLYADRSRALYEQEVRSDLGDAMVQISDSRLRSAEAEFATAMAWSRMHVCMGLNVAELAKALLEPAPAVEAGS